jgi:DNA-binding beta-propeller fold protein YncE
MPPPNGLMYFAAKSQLQATPDGTKIVGVNQLANNTRTVFVFDVASSTVLASRNVAGTSPILAVSPDGSEFLSGSMLFETSTLLVPAPVSPPRPTRAAPRSCPTARSCSPPTISFRC